MRREKKKEGSWLHRDGEKVEGEERKQEKKGREITKIEISRFRSKF